MSVGDGGSIKLDHKPEIPDQDGGDAVKPVRVLDLIVCGRL
jgi:hypothetical protein